MQAVSKEAEAQDREAACEARVTLLAKQLAGVQASQ
jgi:hypothetical protein